MAIYSANSANALYRTTDFPDLTAITISVWAKRDSTGDDYYPIIVWHDGVGGETYRALYAYSVGDTYFYDRGYQNDYIQISGDVGTSWAWYGWRRIGNSTTCYGYRHILGGSETSNSATSASSSLSPGRCDCAAWPYYTETLNGRVAALKVWTVALTEQELLQEKWIYTPQRTANLYLWSPFIDNDFTNFRDYSGNGRHWTETGTVTLSDNPPIAWTGQPARFMGVAAAPPSGDYKPEIFPQSTRKRQTRNMVL